ncbi:MAG: S-layer homology domain-containing protein, partial [Agathobaculum butyriciproducens]
MKRRLLSAFLAVMMVLTMAPVAFAADTSVDSYDSLVEAINSASDGDTITLNGDIDVQQTLVVTKKLTLDLAGYKLYNTNDLWEKSDADNWSLISVRGTGNLTITGNGTLPAKENDCYAVDVQDKGASVTIENGTFVGNIHAVYVHDGTAFIKGGSYSIQQKYPDAAKANEFVLNCYDASRQDYEAKIYVSGGSFEKFNPADCKAEGEGTNFCEEGYTTTQNGDTYAVDAGTNAAVANAGANYNTIATAVAVVKNGGAVTLLKDTAEDVVIPATATVNKKEVGKILTIDLAGHKLTNVNSHTIFNKGTLTINGNNGTVDNVTNGTAAVYNDVTGKVTINGGSYTRSAEASKDENNSGGNSWYVIHNYGIMNINKGTFKFSDTNVGAFSSLIHNGWYDGSKNTAQKNAVMTINDGDFTQGTGGKITVKNDDYGELEIKGGVFTQPQKNYYCILSYNIAKISGGTINGYVGNAYGNETCDKGDLTISDNAVVNGGVQSATAAGNDSSDKKNLIKITDNAKVAGAITSADVKYVSVSGGYFTTDPSKYLATSTDADKKYIAKAVTGDYKFHVELADKNDLQVVPVAGATAAPSKDELTKNKDIPSDQVDNIVTAAKAVSAPEISKAAQEVAANISDNSNTLGKQYQDAAKDEVPNQEKIEVRTYLDVEPKAYNKSAYTLDITPKYDVVVVGTKNGAAAEKVVASDTLKVTNATNVSIQLPADFVENTDTLYVQHKGHEYDAAVTANNGVYTANFTNPHGFSPFTISKTSQTVATIGTDKYTSFADAVSEVPANGTIEITGGTSPYTGTANKTFTVKNSTSADITVNGQPIEPTKSYTFKYTHSSGGSSGGSSSGKTTYKVPTSAVNNGGVNASPSSAEKGATITITLSPDKGYKLDKLTVTDGSGKTVSTVKKSDTVYTFTMPASAVKVGVSYVKATETPSKTKFNDVSANDWFASAVDYVTGKGMMNGTADNTFSPKANTTRGMVVT